ncbi:MAG: hypothetical protein ACJA1O_003151 [Spirosomataceae bacterium]|jgi:hypothetical protein
MGFIRTRRKQQRIDEVAGTNQYSPDNKVFTPEKERAESFSP